MYSHIIIIFNWTHLWPYIVERRKIPSLIMCYCPCQDSLQAGDCDLQNVSRASSICSVNIFSILSPFTSIGEDTWHLTPDIWHLTMGEQNGIISRKESLKTTSLRNKHQNSYLIDLFIIRLFYLQSSSCRQQQRKPLASKQCQHPQSQPPPSSGPR